MFFLAPVKAESQLSAQDYEKLRKGEVLIKTDYRAAGVPDEVGSRLPLVCGIWADGSLEAARIARMAAEDPESCAIAGEAMPSATRAAAKASLSFI